MNESKNGVEQWLGEGCIGGPVQLRFSREIYERRKQFVVGIRGQIFEG